ncbi:zf-HC2 domain-containing protein [Candidatus Riflebacteria bacterium]
MKEKGGECREIRKLLSDFYDELLGHSDNEKIESHLKICQDCKQNLENYQVLSKKIKSLPVPVFTDDIWKKISSEVTNSQPIHSWIDVLSQFHATLFSNRSFKFAIPAMVSILFLLIGYKKLVEDPLRQFKKDGVVAPEQTMEKQESFQFRPRVNKTVSQNETGLLEILKPKISGQRVLPLKKIAIPALPELKPIENKGEKAVKVTEKEAGQGEEIEEFMARLDEQGEKDLEEKFESKKEAHRLTVRRQVSSQPAKKYNYRPIEILPDGKKAFSAAVPGKEEKNFIPLATVYRGKLRKKFIGELDKYISKNKLRCGKIALAGDVLYRLYLRYEWAEKVVQKFSREFKEFVIFKREVLKENPGALIELEVAIPESTK